MLQRSEGSVGGLRLLLNYAIYTVILSRASKWKFPFETVGFNFSETTVKK